MIKYVICMYDGMTVLHQKNQGYSGQLKMLKRIRAEELGRSHPQIARNPPQSHDPWYIKLIQIDIN